jgi:hypothetical protein
MWLSEIKAFELRGCRRDYVHLLLLMVAKGFEKIWDLFVVIGLLVLQMIYFSLSNVEFHNEFIDYGSYFLAEALESAIILLILIVDNLICLRFFSCTVFIFIQ